MPHGQDLKRRIEELAQAGVTGREAGVAIFAEDYDSPTGKVQQLLGLSPLEMGRLKATARQRIHRAQQKEKKAGTPEKAPTTPEASKAEPSPSGKEFRRVADQVLRKVASTRKDYLAELYDRQTVDIRRDRRSLENFLFRHGLTHIQVAGFLDMLIPGSDYQPVTAQQQAMAMDPRTGQQFPIIVMPQQGGGQPMVIQAPGPPGPAPGLSAEDVRRIIRDEVWERERHAPQHPPPPPSPHMARYPALGDDGRQLRDPGGTLLWIERPVDPSMSMLEFLRPVLFREPPPPPQQIDEEKLFLQVREIIRQEVGDTRARREEVDVEKLTMKIREQISAEFAPHISALEKQVEAQQRQTEIEEAVPAAVKPLMLQLSEYQGKTNVEKDERTQERAQRFVRETLDSVKGAFKDAVAMVVLPSYATLEQEKGLPEGTLTGPIMDKLRGTVKEFKSHPPPSRGAGYCTP